MKEPARTINKVLCVNRRFRLLSKIAYGSFKTIPNPPEADKSTQAASSQKINYT